MQVNAVGEMMLKAGTVVTPNWHIASTSPPAIHPLPVTVTIVPPPTSPRDGLMPATVGRVRYQNVKLCELRLLSSVATCTRAKASDVSRFASNIAKLGVAQVTSVSDTKYALTETFAFLEPGRVKMQLSASESTKPLPSTTSSVFLSSSRDSG